MDPMNIFRKGKHTSSAGSTINFTEDDLQRSVEAYDPNLHEAPICIGHPKDNLPAYGWIQSVSFDKGSGDYDGVPHQVDQAFMEMNRQGKFKKRSASFYHPDSPNNPVPGVYYLRHVAFLGAQAPAVKGLRDYSFSDADDDLVIEFEDDYMQKNSIARLFRRLREYFVERDGVDAADKVIPQWDVEDLEAAAREALNPPTSEPAPGFSEGDNLGGKSTMTPEELQAAENKLKADQDALQAREDAIAARETSFTEKEKQASSDKLKADIQLLVDAGKVLPAEVANVTAFAETLSDETEVEFSEGDKTAKLSPRAYYLKSLADRKPGPDFSERSGPSGHEDVNFEDPNEFAEAIQKYQAEQAAAGRHVTVTQAAAAVKKAAG